MKNQKALVTNEDQFYKNHYLYYCIDKEPERCDTKVKPRQVTSAKLLSKNKYHDAYFEGAKNELVNYKKDNIYSKK